MRLSIDGVVGPATKQAIINYQSRHGLTTDGYAGPATFAKMGIKRTYTPSGDAAPIVQPISGASDKVACASGTRDLGATTGYYSGKAIKVHLCAIPGFSSTGLESMPGHRYYISGANRATASNNAQYMWMRNNATRFGFR